MTDYTKIVNYAIKDTLAPGTPEKRVRGTELDAEFEAIELASATKIDEEQKNTAGGVAGLTAAGLLPPAIIPDYADIQSLIALLGDGIAVLTGALQANLNADQLDGQEGAYYLDASNLTNTIGTIGTLDSVVGGDGIDVDVTDPANPQIDVDATVVKTDSIQTLTTPNKSTWLSVDATTAIVDLDLSLSHLFTVTHSDTGNVAINVTNGATSVGQTVIIELTNGALAAETFTLGTGFEVAANRTGADTLSLAVNDKNIVTGIVGTTGLVLL